MEKIYKEVFKINRSNKSKIANGLVNKSLQRALYQASDVGYEYNEKNYYAKREGGVKYLLAYTKSGQAHLNYDGIDITILPNSLTFIYLANPSLIESLNNDWEIYFIHVVGSDIDDIYRTATQGKRYNFKNFNGTNFINYIENIYKSYSKQPNEFFISQQIYSLLMDVLNQTKKPKLYNIVEKGKEYLEKNYNKEIFVEEISSELFVSKYYFIRVFEEQLQCSPKQYLTQIRVQKAKSLLIHTEKSVKEIATLVGFGTEKNIVYAFKSALGVTPNEFRKNLYK